MGQKQTWFHNWLIVCVMPKSGFIQTTQACFHSFSPIAQFRFLRSKNENERPMKKTLALLVWIKLYAYRAFSQRSKCESTKHGRGKTSKLLCSEPICNVLHSAVCGPVVWFNAWMQLWVYYVWHFSPCYFFGLILHNLVLYNNLHV